MEDVQKGFVSLLISIYECLEMVGELKYSTIQLKFLYFLGNSKENQIWNFVKCWMENVQKGFVSLLIDIYECLEMLGQLKYSTIQHKYHYFLENGKENQNEHFVKCWMEDVQKGLMSLLIGLSRNNICSLLVIWDPSLPPLLA